MDKSNLEIKPINFIVNGLKSSSSSYAKVSDSEAASVFSELQDTMKSNGNSISAQDFYHFFGSKYQIDNGNFAAATNILASFDGDDREISFKDFGLYEASYEVLMSLNCIDKNNITQQQVTNIANILNSTGKDGKTLNQIYNEAVNALGLSNNRTYDDIKSALLTLSQKFFTNQSSMDSKIYAYDFTNLGKEAFEDFLKSNGIQSNPSPEKESSNAKTNTESTVTSASAAAPTSAVNNNSSAAQTNEAQQTPIEVSVQGWTVDNNKHQITTKYGETLTPATVNQKNIIMGSSNSGYGVYYDKPNSYAPDYKGEPLGYYTQDKNGNTVFFKFDNNSQRRLPENYTRVGNDIFDSDANKMYEESIYNASNIITARGYRLEQGNYDKTNRKIFDNNGDLIGYVRELEDGYTSCYFYNKPVKITTETAQESPKDETASPSEEEAAVTSEENTVAEPSQETPKEEAASSSEEETISGQTQQEGTVIIPATYEEAPAEENNGIGQRAVIIMEPAQESPQEDSNAKDNSADGITREELSETINNIFAREDISALDKLKLVREIRNKYGDSIEGKLEYDAREFYYFISEFMPDDIQAEGYNIDNLIEMVETYKLLTGCDFSTLGKDLKKNKDRLNNFLYGMFNAINISNTAQARKLNEYFDFVGLIQSNFSGKKETELLECLFSAAYQTGKEDAKYAERHDIGFKWYCVNKALESVYRLSSGKNKNAQEARAYVYKACEGNIAELIKKYRSGMIGANQTQENELSMLLKLFLGYELDEILN